MAQPIVHIEITADDPKAAGKFYEDAFGWQIHTDQQFDYTMFQAEGGPGGGFISVSGAASMGAKFYEAGKALLYINSDDVDADLRKVESLGGSTVAPKYEIPGVGWFGVFKDPAGNTMALFKAAPRQG